MENFKLSSELVESCFEEAEKGYQKGEVPVGCLFIRNDQDGECEVIAKAHNRTNEFKTALKHAEIDCINQVVEKFSDSYRQVFKDTIVVLTLEPCVMCCRILRRLQVKSVLYGAQNERFGGAGSVFNIATDCRIKDPQLECISNFLDSTRAVTLLQKFYDQTNENAPKNKVNLSRSNI